jgi:hypothetical protein
VQDEKHSEQRISTNLGIQIEDSDEQSAKAARSIRESIDFGSNVTSRREGQGEKHWAQRTTTQFGMQTQDSDLEHENKCVENSREPATNSILLSSFPSSSESGALSPNGLSTSTAKDDPVDWKSCKHAEKGGATSSPRADSRLPLELNNIGIEKTVKRF